MCRLVLRLSYLSADGSVRDLANSIIHGNRHIFDAPDFPSPSRFACREFIPLPDWSLSSLTRLSRVGHLDWVLSAQGDFHPLYESTIDSLMRSDGPLPVPWRHWIAMMASSVYGCEYLVRNQLELFLCSGGDPNWLVSPDTVPRKLSSLEDFSLTLAHRPWTIDHKLIDNLTSNYRWNLSELVHAILILSTFHSLPCLVFGSGICLEPDLVLRGEELVELEEIEKNIPKCFHTNDSLIIRLTRQQSLSTASDRSSNSSEFDTLGQFDGQKFKLSEEEKSQLSGVMTSKPKWLSPVSDSLHPPTDHPAAAGGYMDIRTDKSLHSHVFSYEDHVYPILHRFSPEVTDCIEAERLHALDFTNNSIGSVPLESTRLVREAIIRYVERMYGICHDDYKYENLNKILTLIHKVYLKKLACYPERITINDYNRITQIEQFSNLDLIHYSHIVSQTKREIELTFAVRAIADYQK
jgi:sestrin